MRTASQNKIMIRARCAGPQSPDRSARHHCSQNRAMFVGAIFCALVASTNGMGGDCRRVGIGEGGRKGRGRLPGESSEDLLHR